MRKNGTIKFTLPSVAGTNEYGEIVEENTPTWTIPIGCFISTNRDNRKGKYEDGEFRMSAYNVLIELYGELDDVMAIGELSSNRVSLTRMGENLGEFRIQSIESYDKVGRINLFVV